MVLMQLAGMRVGTRIRERLSVLKALQVLKWLGYGLVALLGGGAIYQQVGMVLDGRLAPPSSEMVSVDGRAVHLKCMGEGSHTFVLDAGAAAGVWEWSRLQPLLAKSGRVCAFDRAGLGWSAVAPGGYDGPTAAGQLAALVRAAGIPTPFIYVGHSLGANFGIIYRAAHPEDVAALVLIEPGDPKDMLEDYHGTRERAMAAQDCGALCYVIGATTYLGIIRVATLTLGHKALDERTRSTYQAFLSRPSTARTGIASLNALPKTAYEDMDVQSFGDTPVLTFASSLPRAPEGKETIEDVKVWRVGHFAYLGTLAAKSSHGVGPVVVPNSTHASMVLGEPQAESVAQAIVAFLAGARL
jgi:pimeloyl-ACP methyl ester carboxylesterase